MRIKISQLRRIIREEAMRITEMATIQPGDPEYDARIELFSVYSDVYKSIYDTRYRNEDLFLDPNVSLEDLKAMLDDLQAEDA